MNDKHQTGVSEVERYEVRTFANGAGLWRAEVLFNVGKSPTDFRPRFNLDSAVRYARRLARRAISREIAARDMKTWEDEKSALNRVLASLPPLQVIEQNISPSTNVWYGITLGE